MGDIRPCCDGDKIVYNNKVFNIGNKSISEIANHQVYYDMIEGMKAGIIPDSCKVCKDKTDPLSPRISNSVTPRNIEITKAAMNGDIKRTINSVHIRVGNTCNLKCRICDYKLSSGWAKDEYKKQFYNKNIAYKDSHIYKTMEDGQWPFKQSNWLSSKELENIVSLHLSGGEPLMVDKTYEMVDSILSVNNNIEIKFNTNSTFKYKEEYLEKLLTAKEINFHLSIDDIGERFEYQRKNAKWDKVSKIAEWYVNLSKKYQNVHVAADVTISIFNVYYLPEIIKEFNKIGLNFRTIDSHSYDHYTRHTNQYYIRRLNKKQKEIIFEKLNKYKENKIINDVINYMSVDKKVFNNKERLDIIKEVDLIRNESFEKVFPELYSILLLE